MATLLRSDFNVYTYQGTVVEPEAAGICSDGQSYDYTFEIIDISIIWRFAKSLTMFYISFSRTRYAILIASKIELIDVLLDCI